MISIGSRDSNLAAFHNLPLILRCVAWRPCNWVSDQSAIIPFSVLPTPNSGWFFFTWWKIASNACL